MEYESGQRHHEVDEFSLKQETKGKINLDTQTIDTQSLTQRCYLCIFMVDTV